MDNNVGSKKMNNLKMGKGIGKYTSGKNGISRLLHSYDEVVD